MENEYEAYIRRLQARRWRIEDIPFYSKDKPPSTLWREVFMYNRGTDYLEIYPLHYGRRCGSNGIGRLREVGLTRIAEHEYNPMWREDPAYWQHVGLPQVLPLDTERMREQQEDYAKLLEGSGVKVYWIDWPDPPVNAWGPMSYMWAAQELMVINGGSIIAKSGHKHPIADGRPNWLARWAFWYLGIPPLLTIAGRGVCEAGALIFLAQNVFITAISAAYNQEGLDQFIPVLRRTADVDELHVQTIRCPLPYYMDPATGVCAHPDMIMGPLDIGKVIVYSPSIDTDTHQWLIANKFETVEVEREEHIRYCPCNLTILEPGKVMVHEDARKSIAAIRRLGVDVIEVPYSEFNKMGGGMACATMLILRDRGPLLEEVRK